MEMPEMPDWVQDNLHGHSQNRKLLTRRYQCRARCDRLVVVLVASYKRKPRCFSCIRLAWAVANGGFRYNLVVPMRAAVRWCPVPG